VVSLVLVTVVMFVARGANVLLIFLTTFLLYDAAERIDGKMLTDFHGRNVPHQQYRLVIGNTHVLGYSVDDPGGHHLLMPIWAYRVAASYLFFISVIGLILNVIVIIVILNDPKVNTVINSLLNSVLKS
jgi:c-opsin